MKKKQRKPPVRSKRKTKRVKVARTGSLQGVMKFVNNVSIGVLFCFILYFAYKKVPGYDWLMKNLISYNVDFIRKNTKMPVEQRSEIKLNYEYRYLHYIAQNTTEDAVILFPFRSSHFEDPKFSLPSFPNSQMTIMRKEHVSYFLYPRKVVFLRDSLTDPYYHEVTHLAIVNNVGKELLPPQARNNVQNGLVPVKLNQRHRK